MISNMKRKYRFEKIKYIAFLSFLITCSISSVICNSYSENEYLTKSFGPLSQQENLEIRDTLEKIKTSFNFLKEHSEFRTSPDQIPYLIKHNQDKKIKDNKFLAFLTDETRALNKDHHDGIICKACLSTFETTHKFIMKKYGWKAMFDVISLLCSIGLNHQICFEYVQAYGDIVMESLVEHYLNAEFICTSTRLCATKHFIKITGDEYAKKILADKPLNKSMPYIDTSAPVWKVLHVTDIHVDLHYVEGSRGMCPKALCCRNETSSVGNYTNEDKAGRWGFTGRCDIPLRTLENFAEKVFKEIKPDFIVWTGDNPGHDAYDDTAFTVAKIFTNLIKEKYNYVLPVYPSLGNHEKYPADEYNPFNNTKENPFLKMYGDLWKDWLGDEAYQTFIKFGGYTKKHPKSNLRILSTNCMLCDVLNFNLIRDPTDPQSQIEWMEKILRQSEKDGEIVYIISHIPPGDVSFLSECAKRYKALLERFSFIIRGNFYGHTHFDEIKIMTEYFNKDKVSSISYIAPSLTTYSFLNPSFRIFEVDSNTKQFKDYIQYRFNMTEANLHPDETPDWDVAYRATSLFNVPFLNETQAIAKYTKNIKSSNENYLRLLDSFFTSGPLYNEYAKLKKMPTYLSCRYNLDIFSDYTKCIGYFTWDAEEYAYEFLNWVVGSWYEKLPN